MKGGVTMNEIKVVNSTKQVSFKENYVLQRRVKEFFIHLILILFGVLVMIPFLWMLSSSLKDAAEIFIIPPKVLPDPPKWHNYIDSWKSLPFAGAYLNSFKICAIVVISTLITSSMAGFAFAKLNFPGRDTIFILFLATMMIPGQVTMIPVFLIMKYLNLLDSHASLIIPGMLANAFGVFLLRQFIKAIPAEMEESAILDGCNHWQIYSRIILPLIKAPLAALGIFSFMNNWNSFLSPIIYLSTPEKFTVPLLLNQFRGLYITNWELMMAAACIAIVPVLVVYVIGQRYIIEGITLTGLKA
jgi:multiple sugar transport system permease protein